VQVQLPASTTEAEVMLLAAVVVTLVGGAGGGDIHWTAPDDDTLPSSKTWL
jgi:hypothetical protein